MNILAINLGGLVVTTDEGSISAWNQGEKWSDDPPTVR